MMNVVRKLYRTVFRPPSEIERARRLGVKIGRDCRLLAVTFGSEPYLVSLGDHVSVTSSQFITHDGGVWVFRDRFPEIDLVAPIRIGNNVFIGAGCKILPGVNVGDNVIIGAGSVVTKSIESNCVAAGVPAKRLKHIDDYFHSVLPRTLSTKSLTDAEKRAFLEDHFSSP